MSALLDPALVAGIVPRPPQQAAVDALVDTWRSTSRAQVRMACGVGKTHVGILAAAATGSSLVVVAVPSRALVDQTLRAWAPYLSKGSATVAVCTADGLWTDTGRVVGPRITTTDAGRIGFLIEQGGPVLAVTTYHSLSRLARAVRDAGRPVDLLVLDEAHHLTGNVPKDRRAALDDDLLPATRRLAMTATPIIASDADANGSAGFDPFSSSSAEARAVSMDDESLFGPVALLYSTREAIEDGYLCDYEVMVVSRVDTPFNRERLPLAALAAAVSERGATRALSFHNWVADARAFSSLLNVSGHDSVSFVADTITGTTSAPARRRALERLSGPCAPGVLRVVTAAKCLREGVDVCAVDAVLFAAPRSSTVEVVQAVGRALRTHPGKERGTIVLPLLLPPGDGTDDDEQLTASQFAHVWKVLRALNSHDPRVAEALTRPPRPSADPDRRGRKNEAREIPSWLHLVGSIDPGTVMARLVAPGRQGRWEAMFEVLTDLVGELGHAHRVKGDHVHHGQRVGAWVVDQRHHHRKGVLDAHRAERLAALPGWAWDEQGLLGHRVVDQLETWAASTGTCRDAPAGPSAYPSLPSLARPGRWLANARRSWREDTLDPSLAARLEALPGWTWEPLSAQDRAGVEALVGFVAWEGTSSVPPGHVEDGFELSAWMDRCGRAYLGKVLPPELHEEILAVCPTGGNGDPALSWDVNRLRSEAGLTALRRFVQDGGDPTRMPTRHRVDVDGLEVNLYQWCARVRWLAGRGELDEDLRAALEDVPGWAWSLRRASRRTGAPIDLPPGVPHGLPHTRRHFGCPCGPCDEAARDFQTRHKQEQVRALTSGWVSAPQGVAHVRRMMARHPWAVPAAVAAAAGIPRTLLGSALNDPGSATVPPWVADRMSTLTEADLRAWHRPGTRGRDASGAHEPGDAVAHRRRLERLRRAGWRDAEVAAALGYRGSAAHVTRPDPSAAVVHALARMTDTLGPDLARPDWLPASAASRSA